MNLQVRGMTLILALVMSSCTTVQSLSVDKQGRPILRKGEQITVFMKDGTIHQMLVGKATETELIGSEAAPPYPRLALPWSEVAQIQAERIHGLKTIGAVLGGIIVIPPYIALEMLDDGDICFGHC
ncbi:MAG: hypothetical protein HUJ31_04105 [Pseudomonadales bacterium]|nr:hypothetical protein [Pseudomonadales bacterium]